MHDDGGWRLGRRTLSVDIEIGGGRRLLGLIEAPWFGSQIMNE